MSKTSFEKLFDIMNSFDLDLESFTDKEEREIQILSRKILDITGE